MRLSARTKLEQGLQLLMEDDRHLINLPHLLMNNEAVDDDAAEEITSIILQRKGPCIKLNLASCPIGCAGGGYNHHMNYVHVCAL